MAARIIPIGYREVKLYNGTDRDLTKEIKFMVWFDKFYFFAILGSLFFAGYALFAYNIFQNVIWDVIFTFVLCAAFIFLMWAAKKEKTFANIPRVKHFTFNIDKVDMADDGGMFVDAYNIKDEMKTRMYRFKFDESFDFVRHFFTLYQVNLNGYKTLHYCRKKVK